MEIALVTQLPIVVVPGLSECAAAVKRGGLIKKRIKKCVVRADAIDEVQIDEAESEEKKAHESNDANDDDAFELFLECYGWMGECPFLTKDEILQEFGRNGVVLRFDYSRIDKFRTCVERLVTKSECNTILCV